MTFQALTYALQLKPGVKLNVRHTPQARNVIPARLAPGATVVIRFGHCCPDLQEGVVTARRSDPDGAVLCLSGTEWIIEPAGTGVSVPGIVSEDWLVRESIVPGVRRSTV